MFFATLPRDEISSAQKPGTRHQRQKQFPSKGIAAGVRFGMQTQRNTEIFSYVSLITREERTPI